MINWLFQPIFFIKIRFGGPFHRFMHLVENTLEIIIFKTNCNCSHCRTILIAIVRLYTVFLKAKFETATINTAMILSTISPNSAGGWFSHFVFIGIQISSSDVGSLFLYLSPKTSKCGLLSKS